MLRSVQWGSVSQTDRACKNLTRTELTRRVRVFSCLHIEYDVQVNLESIIFYILLVDSLGAAVIAWSGGRAWWQSQVPGFAEYFPLVKGWTTYYLVLIILMGIMLYRLDALVLPW